MKIVHQVIILGQIGRMVSWSDVAASNDVVSDGEFEYKLKSPLLVDLLPHTMSIEILDLMEVVFN